MKAEILLEIVTEKKAQKKASVKTHRDKLNQFKKDLKIITKDYRMLKSDLDDLDRFKKLKSIVRTYREKFEEWVYNQILLQQLKTREEVEKEDFYERDVRSKAWTAYMYLGDNDMFPDAYDYRTDSHKPDPASMIRTRDKVIRRYQRAFLDAFKAIDELLKTKGDTLLPKIREENIESVSLRILPGVDEKDVEKTVFIIKQARRKLDKFGLSKVLKGLLLTLDPTRRGSA